MVSPGSSFPLIMVRKVSSKRTFVLYDTDAKTDVITAEESTLLPNEDLTPLAFGGIPEPLDGLGHDQGMADVSLPLWQLALAGSITTIFADGIMHPVDCIKTLQQSNAGASLNLLGAAVYLYQTAGLGAFYQGFLEYGITDSLGGAVKFAVWETWKQATVDRKPQVVYLSVGASLAFVASSTLIVPGELVKQQLQMGYYDGLVPVVQGIYTRSGLSGFFVGYEGVFSRDVPYTVLELGLYEIFMDQIGRLRPTGQRPAAWEDICAAFVTGAITAVLTTPLDTVKTKLMVGDFAEGTDFFEAFLLTVQNQGPLAVFAGVLARVCWIVPFTALYLPTYDFLKLQLKKRRRDLV